MPSHFVFNGIDDNRGEKVRKLFLLLLLLLSAKQTRA
jgi:hypothetical protein